MLTDKKALGFKDVLISPCPSNVRSRSEVSLEREFTFKNGLTKTLIPIIAANMANIGTFKVAKILSKYKMLTCLVKTMPVEAYATNFHTYPEIIPYVAVTVGLHENNYLEAVMKAAPVEFICLDVANGYMEQFVHFVLQIKAEYPNHVVIAGNVATREGADRLYEAGADIVKVGIGSGSVCTTRYKTGVGVPQISAIDDCMADTTMMTTYMCSDGGCTNPGDVAKAFVAGADFVMLGGMLADTTETGPVFNGSAFEPLCGDRGKATDHNRDYKTSEGKRVIFDHTQGSTPLDDRIRGILGGLRSTGAYIGQNKIENFYKADLIQVTEQTNDWLGGPR